MVIHYSVVGFEPTILSEQPRSTQVSSTAESSLHTVDLTHAAALQHVTAEKLNKEERQMIMKRGLR